MKIIDLINLRAEGKKKPKKIRIDHWCYNFEWIEHESNYYDRNAEIDLMSCLSMDKEELNYEVEIIEEDNKIEKLEQRIDTGLIGSESTNIIEHTNRINRQANYLSDIVSKVNELIDKVNNMENNK